MGQFTALVMLAEIGDITRFRAPASWPAGPGYPDRPRLGPSCPARAHLQAGLGLAAVGLNQAAQTAKRSPEFSATYTAIAKRRGKKIATIAISRKLLTRAWHLLAAAQAPAARTDGSAPAAHPQTGRVTKPRASSLSRHAPGQRPRSII